MQSYNNGLNSSVFCGVRWFEADVSGLPIGPVSKCQAVQLTSDNSANQLTKERTDQPTNSRQTQVDVCVCVVTSAAPRRSVLMHSIIEGLPTRFSKTIN